MMARRVGSDSNGDSSLVMLKIKVCCSCFGFSRLLKSNNWMIHMLDCRLNIASMSLESVRKPQRPNGSYGALRIMSDLESKHVFL